jgi:hypothetical protein
MKLPPHVESSAIVLEDVQLVYVPVPKVGSTAVLWSLLELTELDDVAFRRSAKLETTRALTIHDTTVWGDARRLGGRGDRHRILEADDWLLFTVVRDPLRRLWSAWVSKLLVHDPRFVAAYGHEPWFPEPPDTAGAIVSSFRAFVAALLELPAERHDPHWSSQAELAGTEVLPYDAVAHVERLPEDLDAVTSHLEARGRERLQLRRENPSLLSLPPSILDRATWEICAELTARDRDAFGYRMPEPGDGEPGTDWVADVEARLPGIHAVIERNERIGDLKRVLASRRAS